MSETILATQKKKGLQRLAPETRAKLADGATVLAAVTAIAGVAMPANFDGVWLRIPVLLALILSLACTWFVVRRKKPGVVLANGTVVSVIGLSVLAMALHKASGYASLAGLVSIFAAFMLKACVHNPFVRGRDLEIEGGKSLVGLILENLESLAAALIVVLLVWHFALEAFQIPTGSMAPTMIGSSVGRGMLTDGDRVLVDKFAFEYRDPMQWEPVVFRFPLRRTDPYVKRCIGIPGNEILIVHGDIYVRQNDGAEIELLEKSPRVREVLWLPMLEELNTRSAFIKNFKTDGDVEFDEGSFEIGSNGRVVFPKGDGNDDAEVTDHDASFGATGAAKTNYNRGIVNDLRIIGEVDFEDSGRFSLAIVRDGDTYEFSISEDGNPELSRERDGQTTDLTTSEMKDFDDSAPFDIDFSIADGRLVLIVEGDEIANLQVGTPMLAVLRELDKNSQINLAGDDAMKLASEQPAIPRRARVHLSGESRFTLEALQRDIYYQGRFITPQQPGGVLTELPFAVKLEEDQYFVLGDNSPGSQDCRFWTQIELWMKDGSQHIGSLHGATQPTLARYLAEAGSPNGESALSKLLSVAQHKQFERGDEALLDSELVASALEDLIRHMGEKNRHTLPFFNNAGGQEVIEPADIKRIQVRRIPYVERKLFAGRPFAVFLSPRGLKLID